MQPVSPLKIVHTLTIFSFPAKAPWRETRKHLREKGWSSPCALGATALSRGRRNPHRFREMRHNHPWLNPRMAEVATAHLLLQNQHRKTKEERRERRSTTQKDKQGQGWVGETCASALAGTLAFRTVAQVLVCSSQTRNLSLSFSGLPDTPQGGSSPQSIRIASPLGTCPCKRLCSEQGNSSRRAMSPAANEACIMAFHYTCHSFAGTRAACCVSCAWHSCLCAPVRRRVLKISHASVFDHGARVAFSPSPYVRGRQKLSQLENDP